MPIQLDAIVSIGSSGAPTIVSAPGINSITRLSTGRYRIQLTDNYAKLLNFNCNFRAPVTGSAVPVDASDASLSVGTVYQIVTVGTSTTANWVTVGVPAGITPAAGVTFKAAATGAGVGNGTVKAIGDSGIAKIELMSDTAGMLSNQPYNFPSGGYIDFECQGPVLTMASYTPAGTNNSATPPIFSGTPATLTGTVTYTSADPASGSQMHIFISLNNSQVQ